jgi:hypothetical protein
MLLPGSRLHFDSGRPKRNTFLISLFTGATPRRLLSFVSRAQRQDSAVFIDQDFNRHCDLLAEEAAPQLFC